MSLVHLQTFYIVFSNLKLEPEKLPVYLLVLCLYLTCASASACPCGLVATWRPTFSNRFPAKWMHTQTCFAIVLLEDDLGDQVLSCYKFGQQMFTEQTPGILPMWPGLSTEPKSCDAVFTIDTGAASVSMIVEKYKYLSSIDYVKEVNAYHNYE